MIIDAYAYLGHWPFRRVYFNTAKSLLSLMDKVGIQMALVSSLSSVFYRNAQSGNEELYEEVRSFRGRLIPLACINPRYPGWLDDLYYCFEKFKMRGVRLHPNFHGYSLRDERVLKLIKVVSEYGYPVSIVVRVEDERIGHWLVRVPPVPIDDIAYIIKSCKDTTFIILALRGGEAIKLISELGTDYKNYLIGISKLTVYFSDTLTKVIDKIGVDRVLFATGMPFQYPECSLLKVECLDIDKNSKEMILWKNIFRIISLYM